jgi:hypothetical protein
VAIAFVSRFSLSSNWGRLEGARDTEALSIINPKIKENDHQFMKTRGFPYNVIKGPFLHVSLMYTVISTRVNFIYFVVYLYSCISASRLRSHVVWSDPGGLPGRVVDPKGPVLLRAKLLAPAGQDLVMDINTVLMTVVDWVGRGTRGGDRGGCSAEVDRSDPGGLPGRVVDPKGPVLLRAKVLAPAGQDLVMDCHTVLMTVVDWVRRGSRGDRGDRGVEISRSVPGRLLGV